MGQYTLIVELRTSHPRPLSLFQATWPEVSVTWLQPGPSVCFHLANHMCYGGLFILGFFFSDFFLICFSLLASWLFGFLASWLFGFLAFWLPGFWAFRLFVGLCGFWWLFGFGFSNPLHSQFLFGRWRFGFCVYAAFGGFGFSHPLLSQFQSGLFGFCNLSLVFGFGFPHHQHHQFRPI